MSCGYTAKYMLKILDRFFIRAIAITNFSRWRTLFLIKQALNKENKINIRALMLLKFMYILHIL